MGWVGAGQSVGRAIALRLAHDGADIAVVDIDEEKIGAVADEVKTAGRNATTFEADVTNRDAVYAAVDHAEKELGGFDIVVNNAGIAQVRPIIDVAPEEVETIFKVKIDRRMAGTTGPRSGRPTRSTSRVLILVGRRRRRTSRPTSPTWQVSIRIT